MAWIAGLNPPMVKATRHALTLPFERGLFTGNAFAILLCG